MNISNSDICDAILRISKGGEGSGHFDHEGRPGEVGGSAPGGGGGGGKPEGGDSGEGSGGSEEGGSATAKPKPPTPRPSAGLVYDSQSEKWVNPRDHYMQKEYTKEMGEYFRQNEAEIKVVNDKFMMGGIESPRVLNEMHSAINAKYDAIGKKISDSLMAKYGESPISMGMTK